jgi:hypothetical protein
MIENWQFQVGHLDFFFKKKKLHHSHENISKFIGYQEWVSSQKSLPPNISAASVLTLDIQKICSIREGGDCQYD